MSKQGQQHTKADQGGQRPAKGSGQADSQPAAQGSQKQQGQQGQQRGQQAQQAEQGDKSSSKGR